MQLSDPARQQLVETVRQFQAAQPEELPKCDDAYRRLYPDQVGLFDFRQTWNQVVRERAKAAEAAAHLATVRAQVEVEMRAQQPPTSEPTTSPTDDPREEELQIAN